VVWVKFKSVFDRAKRAGLTVPVLLDDWTDCLGSDLIINNNLSKGMGHPIKFDYWEKQFSDWKSRHMLLVPKNTLV